MSHIDPGIPDPETAEIWWQKLVGGQTKGKKWCCERVSDHAYIGHAIINRYQAANGTNSYELGYILPQHHWGFGFATEIVRAPANFSRETMRLEQIYATVDFENTASIHVLVKTGFQLRGHAIDENGKYPVYILNH
jgi:RimJ/RimL family protein N-acetyltransferase